MAGRPVSVSGLVGYISEILYESTLGLRSIRQAQSHSFTKSQMAKLLDLEIGKLEKDMDQLKGLKRAVDASVDRIRSTFQSARNFHDSLVSLLTQQNFDVGF